MYMNIPIFSFLPAGVLEGDQKGEATNESDHFEEGVHPFCIASISHIAVTIELLNNLLFYTINFTP